ncbi:MAG: hydroxyacid dehydrogenase, partial [Gammaproteobacteria bacterium]|nr:hydroxyacid dehydrogenase [Gammaproteobacteria bacterium]
MSDTSDLIERLRGAVGPANVLTDGDLTAWEQDWRRRSRGKALAVVRPADTQQVAQVVKLCAASGTAIV